MDPLKMLEMDKMASMLGLLNVISGANLIALETK